jgi:hypothetical protein
MQIFKVGDIVCHVAGKTKMAVAAIKMPDGDLVCEWQDDHGKPHPPSKRTCSYSGSVPGADIRNEIECTRGAWWRHLAGASPEKN